MRPSWDQTWYSIAETIALRSDCVSRQVGCVIVSEDNRTHWVGYNGAPGGYPEAVKDPVESDGLPGCSSYCGQGREVLEGLRNPACEPMTCVSVHAEINALIQSDRSRRLGGTAYVTAAPCMKCGSALANSGIKRVVSPAWEATRIYEGSSVLTVFDACGVEWVPGWAPRS